MAEPAAAAAPPTPYKSMFKDTIQTVPSAILEVLETYSGIPRDSQIAHILAARDAAYAKCPYPCIGNLRFLDFDLSTHPLYQEHVLAPLTKSVPAGIAAPLFLDLGTCFGQDVRKLVYDGAPVERVWASDIEQHLIDMGYKLFNDEDKLPRDKFLCPGDLLSSSPADKLHVLDDKVSILHMTAVFHLFTLEDQRRAAHRCLQLLRKDTGGPVLLLGMQVGSVVAGPFSREDMPGGFSHKYRHNVETWENMWREVVEASEWKDRVKGLDVKSQLLNGNTKPQSAESPTSGDALMRRHLFEVWVDFR